MPSLLSSSADRQSLRASRVAHRDARTIASQRSRIYGSQSLHPIASLDLPRWAQGHAPVGPDYCPIVADYILSQFAGAVASLAELS